MVPGRKLGVSMPTVTSTSSDRSADTPTLCRTGCRKALGHGWTTHKTRPVSCESEFVQPNPAYVTGAPLARRQVCSDSGDPGISGAISNRAATASFYRAIWFHAILPRETMPNYWHDYVEKTILKTRSRISRTNWVTVESSQAIGFTAEYLNLSSKMATKKN
jgi:hypothetical protein